MNIAAAPDLQPLAAEAIRRERPSRQLTWQPWRAPRLTTDELRLANRLHRRHADLAIGVGRSEARVRPARPADLSAPAWIELRLDGRSGLLQLEEALLERLTAGIDEHLDWRSLPRELEGLLLEVVLEPWLAALEELTTRRIEIVGRRAGMAAGAKRPLHLEVALDERVLPARLWLDPQDVAAFVTGWAARARAPAAWSDLPLVVARCVARSTLTPAELRELRAGDVILIDATLLPEPRLLLTVGGHLVVPVTLSGEDVAATGELRRINSLNGVLRAMVDDVQAESGQESMATLDEVPLRIAFELGRMELPLGELRMVGPGYVFPMDRELGAAVEIRCGDRRIGVGEIVHIEDQLGVRVVKLFDHG